MLIMVEMFETNAKSVPCAREELSIADLDTLASDPTIDLGFDWPIAKAALLAGAAEYIPASTAHAYYSLTLIA